MRNRLVVEGSVVDAETGSALAGIGVRAFLGNVRRARAQSVTNDAGTFSLEIDAGPRSIFEPEAALMFGLYLPDARAPFTGPPRCG